jgi:hypothetical protein
MREDHRPFMMVLSMTIYLALALIASSAVVLTIQPRLLRRRQLHRAAAGQAPPGPGAVAHRGVAGLALAIKLGTAAYR